MPEFRTEIDIEPYEYVDECSRYEIKELIDCLVERGYLESHEPVIKEKDSTLEDLEWNTVIDKLYKNRRYLSAADEEYIKNLSKRF